MATTEPRAEVDPRFGNPSNPATPWSDVLAVLEGAELFWVSTVRNDGRPHVVPVPAVWCDDALHFCTGPEEQKAVNLARNASCALTTGNNEWKQGLDVVVEGRAERITDDTELQRLADRWASKYHGDWQWEVRDGAFHEGEGDAIVFRVAPMKILSFKKGDFAQTRYRFDR